MLCQEMTLAILLPGRYIASTRKHPTGGQKMNRFMNMVLAASAVLFAFIYKKAVHKKTVAKDARYVVPAKSNKYHYPSCRWAQKFRSENLAVYRSAKDALGEGYLPCKVCKPPGKE
jgi:Metal binding domain of Ada